MHAVQFSIAFTMRWSSRMRSSRASSFFEMLVSTADPPNTSSVACFSHPPRSLKLPLSAASANVTPVLSPYSVRSYAARSAGDGVDGDVVETLRLHAVADHTLHAALALHDPGLAEPELVLDVALGGRARL